MKRCLLGLAAVLLLLGLDPRVGRSQSAAPPVVIAQATSDQGPLRAAPASSRPAAEPAALDGLWLWIMQRQRELTQAMTSAVRRIKSENVWIATLQLTVVSFLYGVFHAAGPGHGKFVISSYALANAQTMRRGIAVSFMAAMVQALSAIALVSVFALVVQATSLEIRRTENVLESASWGLIALLGGWLLYRQLAPLVLRRRAATAHREGADHDGAAHRHHDDCHHHHHHDDGCHHHDHKAAGHDHAARDGHHAHGAEGCSACGHTHAPRPAELQGAWSWRQAWTLAFAIGIRPCTGAIAVLLFSLSISLFAAGIFATFAMAIGTALTVSTLAVIAVKSRNLAARLSGPDDRWASRIQTAAGVVGSFLVFILGASFFIASLRGSGPL